MNGNGAGVDRLQRLELDVDTMCVDLWREAAQVEEWTLELAAAYMRAGFGRGYVEALTEPSPGSFCRRNGYAVPVRRRP